MENHILHFSSPRQNNDFIVYHNRAKSTIGGSQTARLKGKPLATESSRDYNSKRSRPDRHGPAASSDFTSPSHGYPLQNRINIVKELMDSSAQSSTNKQSLILDAENDKRMNELEEEIKELRKRLKARDVRINYLVQENESAREKLNEIRHLENQNSLFQNENKCLKSEVEILTKRVGELEEEKASYQTEKHSNQKTNSEEITRGLAKYARHIVSYLETMESSNVANFYFEERFLSDRHLSKLVKTKDYGLIALSAFRYISDLLAHVATPSQSSKRDQQKKTHLMPKEKKEYKVQPSEPSSICLSPLKNDSKENTPRSLVRELEGRGMMMLDGFDKVYELRKDPAQKSSKSAEGRNQNQDLMKKCLTARESKHNIQKSISGAPASGSNPLKNKNMNQASQAVPSKTQKGSYAQMHGKAETGRTRTKESVDRDGETQKYGHILINKRRDTEDKEKQPAVSSKSMRYRETEEDEIAKIEKGLRSENPGSIAKRRVQTEEADTYASLGVNIKTFGEGHYGRRAREYEKNERDGDSGPLETEEGDDDFKHPMSVRSLLRHGLGGQDQKEGVEIKIDDYRKERMDAKMQQHLSPRDVIAYENDSYENRAESKKLERGFEDHGKETFYNKAKANRPVFENNLIEDSKYDKYAEDDASLNKKRHRKSQTHAKINVTNSRKGLLTYEGEDSEKFSKGLNITNESSNPDIVRESISYGKKYYQPQQIERPDDINRNFQSSKDRLYSVQSPNRPFSVQGNNTTGAFENIAERVITFDGTDSQSLFMSGEKEPHSGNTGKKPGHRPSESEYYSLGPKMGRLENAQHQRFSSDIHAASIAEAMLKKRMDQNMNAQEQLYRKSMESKRGKQGRGDFNN